MSAERLHTLRAQLPATQEQIYLNTGTFGPLATPTIEAMQAHMQFEHTQGRISGNNFEKMFELAKEAREEVARLLRADPEEIALTTSTGDGMNHISYGFNWQAGDEVITTNHEHISGLAALYQIRNRFGVNIRMADLGQSGDGNLREAIAPLINARTRLLVLSHVSWATGAVLDIAAAVQLAQEHGIFVLVDGAQSAGAIPIDVHALEVDAYAIPNQKWLCGPEGSGALYIRKESLARISSTYVGYWSQQGHNMQNWDIHNDARRFEVGGRSSIVISGQVATLRWLRETVGYSDIYQRISTLHRYAFKTLQQVPGLSILTPLAGASGLISFTLAGEPNYGEIVKTLADRYNIRIRSLPEPFVSLRASTGFYTKEQEIDQLVKALKEIVAEQSASTDQQ